jgi:hypothetical protein
MIIFDEFFWGVIDEMAATLYYIIALLFQKPVNT